MVGGFGAAELVIEGFDVGIKMELCGRKKQGRLGEMTTPCRKDRSAPKLDHS
jgi:hypothetical protein